MLKNEVLNEILILAKFKNMNYLFVLKNTEGLEELECGHYVNNNDSVCCVVAILYDVTIEEAGKLVNGEIDDLIELQTEEEFFDYVKNY